MWLLRNLLVVVWSVSDRNRGSRQHLNFSFPKNQFLFWRAVIKLFGEKSFSAFLSWVGFQKTLQCNISKSNGIEQHRDSDWASQPAVPGTRWTPIRDAPPGLAPAWYTTASARGGPELALRHSPRKLPYWSPIKVLLRHKLTLTSVI